MPALDLSGARWRKSSRSTDKANCVEVAVAVGAVAVRDSKNPTGGVLAFPRPSGPPSPPPCTPTSSADQSSSGTEHYVLARPGQLLARGRIRSTRQR